MNRPNQTDDPRCPDCGAPLRGDASGELCLRCALGNALEAEGPAQRSESKGQRSDGGAASEVGRDVPIVLLSPIQHPAPGIEHPAPRFGDYELLAEIARGGMGVVYKARQVSLDRIVAVKMILFGPLASAEQVRRFRTEASAAGCLQHPSIVAIHEVGLHEQQHYLVMDYVDGPNLGRLVHEQGSLPAKHAASYVKTIAEAVHYAHERGILHRDLKPSNVLIDANDRPRVVDFGLAKRLAPDTGYQILDTGLTGANIQHPVSSIEYLTLSGQVLGSPNYMPPEQAGAGRDKVGRYSDVYSLGAILYHLLTGRPPFQAETVAQTLNLVSTSDPVSPRMLNPGVPRDLETICLKCLEKEPGKRYATAQALADELGRFLNDEPIRARPVSRAERVWRWCRRKPVIAALAATTALLLLAVAIGSPIALVRINREKLRAEQTADARRLDLYVADMKVAYLALQEGNRGLAIERLKKYLPEFGVPASAGSGRDRTGARPERLKAGLQTDLRGFEWQYLWKLCEGEELFTFSGHTNRVVSVAFDRTGTWLASNSDDETVRIWSIVRRESAQVFPIAGRYLHSVAFSPSNDALAIGGELNFVLDELVGTERNDALAIRSELNREVVPRATKGEVRIRDGTGWRSERVLTNARGPLVFAPDGRTLVTAGAGGMMIWDTETWQLIRRLDELTPLRYSEHVSNPAFSPDGTSFALATYEERPEGRRARIHVWPFATLKSAGLEGSPSVLLDPGTNAVANIQALRFSPDGEVLAVGDWAGFIGLWETVSGSLLASANVAATITDFVFLTDGRTFVSTCKDQHLLIWDYSSRTNLTLVGRRQGHNHEVWAAALSPNGQLLATGGKDATVKLWDAASLRTPGRSQPHPGIELPIEHHPIWISHDGRQVAAVNGRLTLDAAWTHDATCVSFVDTATLAILDSISFTPKFEFIALATNGQRLAVGRTNGVVEIWDVANKQRPISTLKSPVDNSGAAWRRSAFGWKFQLNEVWSPDGNRLVTFWPGVKVWDVQTGLGRELPINREVGVAGFSPDGTALAIVVWEGVELWNSLSEQRITVCKGRMSGSASFAFSRDSRKLLAWANENAWLWEVPSGKLLGTLSGHSLGFDHGAFSPDGRTVATHLGGSFTLWNVRNGQELFSLKMGRLGQGRVLFSGDGQTLLVHKARRPALVLRAPLFQ